MAGLFKNTIQCEGLDQSWPAIHALLNRIAAGRTTQQNIVAIKEVLTSVDTERGEEVNGLVRSLEWLYSDNPEPHTEFRKYFMDLLRKRLPKDPAKWYGSPCPRILIAAFSEVLKGWVVPGERDSKDCFSTACFTYRYFEPYSNSCYVGSNHRQVFLGLNDALGKHLEQKWKNKQALGQLGHWMAFGILPHEMRRAMVIFWNQNIDPNTLEESVGAINNAVSTTSSGT